jgi:hypothetical protein
VVRGKPVEGLHLGEERRHVPVAECEVVLAGLPRLSEHVVVDIGQVLDVRHVVPEVLEVAMDDVEADVRERMTQMAGVVRRHATDVEADVRSIAHGRERVQPAPAGVVEPEHQCAGEADRVIAVLDMRGLEFAIHP